MPAIASQIPWNDDRIVLYGGFAYRRIDDGVFAAAPAGSFETVAAAILPLPVARALGLAERAATWLPLD